MQKAHKLLAARLTKVENWHSLMILEQGNYNKQFDRNMETYWEYIDTMTLEPFGFVSTHASG